MVVSRYLCDLCYATEETAKVDLGTFKICHTLEDNEQIAGLLHFNPNKLTRSQLSALANRVTEHKVDATHGQINFGTFCYKFLVREIAGVTQSNETTGTKHHIKQATNNQSSFSVARELWKDLVYPEEWTPHSSYSPTGRQKADIFQCYNIIEISTPHFSSRKPKE